VNFSFKKFLVFVVTIFLTFSFSFAEIKTQAGLSGQVSNFVADTEIGFGISGNFTTIFTDLFGVNLDMNYHTYARDLNDFSIYAMGNIYLRRQGFRPFITLGYGHHFLSGTFSKVDWVNGQAVYSEQEDMITGPGIRLGAGTLYPLGNYYSANFRVMLEHQRELAENVKFQIGVSRSF